MVTSASSLSSSWISLALSRSFCSSMVSALRLISREEYLWRRASKSSVFSWWLKCGKANPVLLNRVCRRLPYVAEARRKEIHVPLRHGAVGVLHPLPVLHSLAVKPELVLEVPAIDVGSRYDRVTQHAGNVDVVLPPSVRCLPCHVMLPCRLRISSPRTSRTKSGRLCVRSWPEPASLPPA